MCSLCGTRAWKQGPRKTSKSEFKTPERDLDFQERDNPASEDRAPLRVSRTASCSGGSPKSEVTASPATECKAGFPFFFFFSFSKGKFSTFQLFPNNSFPRSATSKETELQSCKINLEQVKK